MNNCLNPGCPITVRAWVQPLLSPGSLLWGNRCQQLCFGPVRPLTPVHGGHLAPGCWLSQNHDWPLPSEDKCLWMTWGLWDTGWLAGKTRCPVKLASEVRTGPLFLSGALVSEDSRVRPPGCWLPGHGGRALGFLGLRLHQSAWHWPLSLLGPCASSLKVRELNCESC